VTFSWNCAYLSTGTALTLPSPLDFIRTQDPIDVQLTFAAD